MAEHKHSLYATAAIWKRSLLYVIILFSFSIFLLISVYLNHPYNSAEFEWRVYLFFFLMALFTDFKGFPHPKFGYVSFDRVTQVSSILVLGPIPAAIINGFASFLFPILSNYLGNDKKATTIAMFNNSGMMVLMMLLSGFLFESIGGELPLLLLNSKQILLLSLLLISIQILNAVFMRLLLKIRAQQIQSYFSWFTTLVELSSGFAGIVFALVYNRMDILSTAMFVMLMMVVIYVINQFALMRDQLENIVKDRTKSLEIKTKQLEYLATHDELTGLVNRRFINQYIKGLLDKQTPGKGAIFIAFADIDDFKKINDNYSHDTGDVVLIQIGKILQQFCHEMLIIARYGGEEFLLCFHSTQKETVIKTCEKIRKTVKALNFQNVNHHFGITVSMGIVNAHDESLHKTLISRADKCLYDAKHNGKNQIIYSD